MSCFSEARRSSRRSLRHSIASETQVVFVAQETSVSGATRIAGAATIFLYPNTLRVYSLAVSLPCRRQGVAGDLIDRIQEYALQCGYDRLTLEADVTDEILIRWYRSLGFESVQELPDYYGVGEPAVRMERWLVSGNEALERVLLVVEELPQGLEAVSGARMCLARDYLSDLRYSRVSRLHVLNLCRSYRPHSLGYYVSLLAAARNHRITPSVMSVKDLSSLRICQSLFEEIADTLDVRLCRRAEKEPLEVVVVLGRSPDPECALLARKLFSVFEVPFFSVLLTYRDAWRVKRIQVHTLGQMQQQYPVLLTEALTAYCARKRYYRTRLKNYKYDLAILVDREERTPPSCPEALARFRRAAEKIGFYVEFITRQDQRRLCEFDALFIRETTAIESHTYAMARHAYTEGLVVIDDPWSILLCSNKVYLHERLANTGVLQPKGWLLTKHGCSAGIVASLSYPLVLKLPESSFSQGVFLVENAEELQERLQQLFARSAIVIAQEFMKSEFDWRIGLMDNVPVFACKYYMASSHWQIYNWATVGTHAFSGESEAVPLADVPPHVLKAATRAAGMIGNGLYGVDVKDVGGKAYIIEVNDNPSIDAGVEDALLGDRLYERIMQSIYDRIDAERTQSRALT
jgi:glutathione synthase/RimK-type ligase-like ATP-grasp enzyme/N-acetylglutamate synthase-like GNAT family acetyltransferase